MAHDLLERLKTGKQQLSEHESKQLLHLLQEKVNKRRFSSVLGDLLKKTPLIEAAENCQSRGTGPEEEVEEDGKSKPKVRILEHVDETRMDEIPSNLIVNENVNDNDTVDTDSVDTDIEA